MAEGNDLDLLLARILQTAKLLVYSDDHLPSTEELKEQTNHEDPSKGSDDPRPAPSKSEKT